MPVRIYDISKKLGLENKEVLAKAKALGLTAARVASSSLDKITAEYLEQQIIIEHPNLTAALAAPPAPAPVVANQPIVVVTAPAPEPQPVAEPEAATATALLEPESPPAEISKPQGRREAPGPPTAISDPPPLPDPPPPAKPAPPPPPPGPKVGDKVGFV